MLHLKKKIVTDESMHPIAVLIDYEDWEKIEQILEHYQTEKSTDLNRFAGVLRRDGEDPLKFQRAENIKEVSVVSQKTTHAKCGKGIIMGKNRVRLQKILK